MDKLGVTRFQVSCADGVALSFNRGVGMLHSFWYAEARHVFEELARADPTCAMAHWGVAMSYYHPLWAPPATEDLKQGEAAVARARDASASTERERAYIEAIAVFYAQWHEREHSLRAKDFENAMAALHRRYPSDHEAALFYSLLLMAGADPADKSLAAQRRAGAIAEQVFRRFPDHPGAAHYVIHAYDYPRLATRALTAARRYAGIAPSSPHALHMPSHTFSQMGAWRESIASNLASKAAARTYGERAALKGVWEEELHAMDYLVYAYLQLAMDADAAAIAREAASILVSSPEHSRKAAYALAAIPARYALERKRFDEAASLSERPSRFPRANALTYFARGYARARIGDLAGARTDLAALEAARAALSLRSEEGSTAATLVHVQILAVSAWIAHAEGDAEGALRQMQAAADLEDRTDDGPVTPGSLVRARELLADLLLELGQARRASNEYVAALAAAPKRWNAQLGAARALTAQGKEREADARLRKLEALCRASGCTRSVRTKTAASVSVPVPRVTLVGIQQGRDVAAR